MSKASKKKTSAKSDQNLIFVESPAKSRTIEGFLGNKYTVIATLGHIKDLPKKEMGVDIGNNFEPKYVTTKGRKKVVSQISKNIKETSGEIYIATDPDREGEAIGWQVHEIAKKNKRNTKRIVFHEITKEAVVSAISNPGDVNMNLVEAQQARRILDRLVGYELSGLIWKKIRYGLSAGRVQSVALRLIVEREKERIAFKAEKYWNLTGSVDDCPIFMVNDKNKKMKVTEKQKKEMEDKINKEVKAEITKVKNQERLLSPPPPLMTSTLQRLANSMFGYSASRTMQIAQKLYQGVSVKGKGSIGLITYMRTDSLFLASKAIKQIRGFVEKEYGKEMLHSQDRVYKTKSKVAQEAHEAIRPTHFDLTPESIKDSLKPEEYKLYSLIWNRTIATQMAQMKLEKISVLFTDENDYFWGTEAQKVKFDGFGKVLSYIKKMNESGFPDIVSKWKQGESKDISSIEWLEKETQPKPRYTEASLVKKMEQLGIGRPSTYANIINTIKNREYIIVEKKYLIPTDNGVVVSDFLLNYFGDIVDYGFTAEMEDNLDVIANGKLDKVSLLKEFYFPFHDKIIAGKKDIKKEDVVVLEKSDEKCPECGGAMVVKLGKNGKFLSCAKFPDCKGIMALDNNLEIDMEKYIELKKCDKCGSDMVLKNGKFGKFWACSDYPKCKNAQPLKLHEKCPECDSNLVERKGKWGKSFIGCSGYPKCRYIKK